MIKLVEGKRFIYHLLFYLCLIKTTCDGLCITKLFKDHFLFLFAHIFIMFCILFYFYFIWCTKGTKLYFYRMERQYLNNFYYFLYGKFCYNAFSIQIKIFHDKSAFKIFVILYVRSKMLRSTKIIFHFIVLRVFYK